MANIVGMRDLTLGTDGDLKVTAGDLVPLAPPLSISQAVSSILQLIKGEWFLDTDAGTDYFGKFFLKNPSLAAIRSEIQTVIESVPGVVAVNSLDLDYNKNTRALSVTFGASTDSGLINSTVTVVTQ